MRFGRIASLTTTRGGRPLAAFIRLGSTSCSATVACNTSRTRSAWLPRGAWRLVPVDSDSPRIRSEEVETLCRDSSLQRHEIGEEVVQLLHGQQLGNVFRHQRLLQHFRLLQVAFEKRVKALI